MHDRYNYALSAAFDSAAQIATMNIFFCLNGVVKIPFPIEFPKINVVLTMNKFISNKQYYIVLEQ